MVHFWSYFVGWQPQRFRVFLNREHNRSKTGNIQKAKLGSSDLIVCPGIRENEEAMGDGRVEWGIVLTEFVVLLLPYMDLYGYSFIFILMTFSTFRSIFTNSTTLSFAYKASALIAFRSNSSSSSCSKVACLFSSRLGNLPQLFLALLMELF